MELIDKDALVAEIKKRLDELWNLLPNASDVVKDNYAKEEANITGKYTALESFENFINTLEVKEVDSEKIINDYFKDWKFDNELDIMVKPNNYSASFTDLKGIAQSFFELGLKVNNDAVIDKAYNWLKNNATYTHPRTGETKCVVDLNAFRDAMKGE